MADEHVEPVEAVELSKSDAETAGVNLKLLEGATSIVWKFFGFEADEDGRILIADKRKRRAVTCNRCKRS